MSTSQFVSGFFAQIWRLFLVEIPVPFVNDTVPFYFLLVSIMVIDLVIWFVKSFFSGGDSVG